MRKRLLSGLVYILVMMGLASLRGELLALAIPLIVYLIAALWYSPQPRDLQVERTLVRKDDLAAAAPADRATAGTPVTVAIVLTNTGGYLEEIHIEDVLPDGLHVIEGMARLQTMLQPGETATLTYTVAGTRGSYLFDDVHVTFAEHLGIFKTRLQLRVPAHLLVLPEVRPLRPIPIRPPRTHGYAGPIPSGQPGSGADFHGVRPYQIGDPRRHINWRLTARHEALTFTNEFEQERIADVGLILDARRQVDIRRDDDALFEHTVRATAALADAFLNDGNRVALLIYGRAMERTFPGYGKFQRERILRSLAQARTGDSMVFETFDYLLTGFFPKRSQLVLVSPLISDDLPVLLRLRARGYPLLIVSPDPIDFEMRLLSPKDPDVALAARISRVERELLLQRLLQHGIRVVDWPTGTSLDAALHAGLLRAQRVPQQGRLGRRR